MSDNLGFINNDILGFVKMPDIIGFVKNVRYSGAY